MSLLLGQSSWFRSVQKWKEHAFLAEWFFEGVFLWQMQESFLIIHNKSLQIFKYLNSQEFKYATSIVLRQDHTEMKSDLPFLISERTLARDESKFMNHMVLNRIQRLIGSLMKITFDIRGDNVKNTQVHF